MGNNGSGKLFSFVCFRCGRVIEPKDKMLTVSVSVETPRDDGSIDGVESYAISSLCFCCASVILTEAVVDKGLTMPICYYQGT